MSTTARPLRPATSAAPTTTSAKRPATTSGNAGVKRAAPPPNSGAVKTGGGTQNGGAAKGTPPTKKARTGAEVGAAPIEAAAAAAATAEDKQRQKALENGNKLHWSNVIGPAQWKLAEGEKPPKKVKITVNKPDSVFSDAYIDVEPFGVPKTNSNMKQSLFFVAPGSLTRWPRLSPFQIKTFNEKKNSSAGPAQSNNKKEWKRGIDFTMGNFPDEFNETEKAALLREQQEFIYALARFVTDDVLAPLFDDFWKRGDESFVVISHRGDILTKAAKNVALTKIDRSKKLTAAQEAKQVAALAKKILEACGTTGVAFEKHADPELYEQFYEQCKAEFFASANTGFIYERDQAQATTTNGAADKKQTPVALSDILDHETPYTLPMMRFFVSENVFFKPYDEKKGPPPPIPAHLTADTDAVTVIEAMSGKGGKGGAGWEFRRERIVSGKTTEVMELPKNLNTKTVRQNSFGHIWMRIVVKSTKVAGLQVKPEMFSGLRSGGYQLDIIGIEDTAQTAVINSKYAQEIKFDFSHDIAPEMERPSSKIVQPPPLADGEGGGGGGEEGDEAEEGGEDQDGEGEGEGGEEGGNGEEGGDEEEGNGEEGNGEEAQMEVDEAGGGGSGEEAAAGSGGEEAAAGEAVDDSI